MSITGCCAQSLSAWLAKIQAVHFLAELLQGTWCKLAINAVVRAIAVATLLALPVCPESLIGGELAAVMCTTTITAGHTKAVAQRKALPTLAALLAWQRTWILRLVQVGAGQRAGAGAFLKMTVVWTGKS